MVATNGLTGQNNAQNLALIREAMTRQEQEVIADQVLAGGAVHHVIPFNYESIEGNTYIGNIEVKKLTAKDLMRIGGIKSEYFREAGIADLTLVDSSVRMLAHVLAYVKVSVVKSPAWLFNIDTIEDTDLLYEVYGLIRKWEDSFRKPVQPTQEGPGETSEDTKTLDS